ncbi:MAG: endosialidase [Lachnospiraceae bacterium]|jgi:hypothetical protein|nr:endosialidase [Lachnospiraceae bacterium]MEE3460782.1 endosialidase [Lachnospiraceae bacterium]
MAVVKELIRKEENGLLSFGNFELSSKAKLPDFKYDGDSYKVKTFSGITRLEKNDAFVYESVPGTVVTDFKQDADNTEFDVEALEDSSITIGLEPEQEYSVKVGDENAGKMKTNLGGKLSLSVELNKGEKKKIIIKKI